MTEVDFVVVGLGIPMNTHLTHRSNGKLLLTLAGFIYADYLANCLVLQSKVGGMTQDQASASFQPTDFQPPVFHRKPDLGGTTLVDEIS